MQPSPSSWRSALRAAFPHTVPILAGFLVLGATYGMLMQAIGYGPLWSGLFSAIAFGGSTQYAAVPLLAAGFDPLEAVLYSLRRDFLRGLHRGAAGGRGHRKILSLHLPAELELLDHGLHAGRRIGRRAAL